MIRAVLPVALLLGGCTQTVYKDRIVTVEVAVPTSSPCVPATLGPAPEYPDGDDTVVRGATGPERYQNSLAGRLLRMNRLRELETVVAGCPKESK